MGLCEFPAGQDGVTMPVRISFEDGASPWLEWAAKEIPAFAASALKSTGWMMQKKIKEGIKSKAPGGVPYAPTMKAKRRKVLDKAFGREPRSSYPILGKLRKAIGYQFDKRHLEVTVGWLSLSAVQLGKRLEEGFQTPVTRRMRLAFAAAGFGMPRKTAFSVPARPTIGPMYDALQNKIYPYMEDQIWSYMQGNNTRSRPKKPKKKYVVKGDWW